MSGSWGMQAPGPGTGAASERPPSSWSQRSAGSTETSWRTTDDSARRVRDLPAASDTDEEEEAENRIQIAFMWGSTTWDPEESLEFRKAQMRLREGFDMEDTDDYCYNLLHLARYT